MTHEEETANFLSDDRECEFCGDEFQGPRVEECLDCKGLFCCKECLDDHLKPDASPRCGGDSE